MADRKANLLVTMVFDENLDMRKQINTELELKNEITKDLQHLMTGREIKHFVIADDEVINKKLTQERKVGKWIDKEKIMFPICSKCGLTSVEKYSFCPNCGAKMKGEEE